MKNKLSRADLKKAFQESPPMGFRVIQWVILAFALASLAAWAFIDFNLDNSSLALIAVVLGLILAYIFELFLESRIPILKKFEKVKKSGIGVYIALIFVDCSPLVAQQFNSRFFNNQPTCQDYVVLAKSGHRFIRPLPFLKQRFWSGYHVFLLMEGVKKDIDCQEDFWEAVVVGKKVKICQARGGLGIDYIKSMEVE